MKRAPSCFLVPALGLMALPVGPAHAATVVTLPDALHTNSLYSHGNSDDHGNSHNAAPGGDPHTAVADDILLRVTGKADITGAGVGLDTPSGRPNISLDLSAKVLWTRQQGDSLSAHQDRLKFKDADSLRIRLGGRFVYAVNEHLAPYIGAYREYEFDGKIHAEVNGRRIGSPSLRGDAGMGELGHSLKPSQDLPLFFDLGVQGYAGKREGVTGSLQL